MAQSKFAEALSAAADKLSNDMQTNFKTLDANVMKNAIDAAANLISQNISKQQEVTQKPDYTSKVESQGHAGVKDSQSHADKLKAARETNKGPSQRMP
jgi:hypothetical protein